MWLATLSKRIAVFGCIWRIARSTGILLAKVTSKYFLYCPNRLGARAFFCKILQVKFGAGAWKVFVATAIMLGCISAMV